MDNDKSAEDVVLDIRGQICPSCLLIALKEVNDRQEGLRSGQAVLSILTDNRQATSTIPGAVENMGYRVAIDKDGAHYKISISG